MIKTYKTSFDITSQRISIVTSTLSCVVYISLEGLTHRLHRKRVSKLQRHVQSKWILPSPRKYLARLVAGVIASYRDFRAL
jgi:hypothetical protein